MRIRSFVFVLPLAAALILAACGGGSESGGDIPPVIVIISDDGKLTLEIPLTALEDDDVDISITAVPLDEQPEELQNLNLRGAGTGYRLEPDGLEFSEPVAVSLELDRSELEDEPEDGISAYALVSYTDAGELELLENLVTEATLGEETVVARGELTHFSCLTKTKGSLTVRMDLLGKQQPVGGTFVADAEAQNSDRTGQATLLGTFGRYFTIGGVVSIQSGETFMASGPLGNGDITRGVAAFKCDMAGVALYGVRVLALSVVEGQKGGTQLEVVVDRDVECFAPGPTATPDPTSTLGPAPTEEPSALQVFTSLSLGCVHGQSTSVVEVWTIDIAYEDSIVGGLEVEPLEGAAIEARIEGPGVLQSTDSVVTDEFGLGFVSFEINQFGQYEFFIVGITDSEGTALEFAPGSETSATLEVGDVCTPAGQVPPGDVTCGSGLGDVNGDGEVTGQDGELILLLWARQIDSLPCPDAADMNGDGSIDFDDAMIIFETTEVGS